MALFILGAGGHAREIAAYARRLERWSDIRFVADRESGPDIVTVAEYHRRLDIDPSCESILGGGTTRVRLQMKDEMRGAVATIVAPGANVWGDVGPGCVVAPGAVIAPNSVLSAHVLVNYCATIGHDAKVGELSVVAPGAAVSGWCILEDAVYLGAGAVIKERLHVGAFATIGMGAVVTKAVPPSVTAIGVPARW